MNSSDTIRIGIIGCGSVMEAYMGTIERLAYRKQAQVVAACDLREQRRAIMRTTYGVQRVTDRYQEIVEAPDIDLVLILTSMNEHGPITRAALAAGKHVLVEKPMSTSLEEAAELVALARTSKGLLLCAPHVLLSPTYQAIAEHVARGDIGKVCNARARYGWSGPDWGTWFWKKGAGPIFDLGVYNVVSLTGWLGPVKRVMAMTGIAVPDRVVEGQKVDVEVEDNAQILLDFGGSVFASVITGYTMQRYRSPAIELYGSDGVIQMLGDDWDPNGYELWRNSAGTWQVYEETNVNWPWTDGVRQIVECIQNGTQPLMTPEHAYHVLDVMVAAQRSGRDGRAYDISSTYSPPAFAHTEAQLLHTHDRTRTL
ncbi:MAG: Gfo/Idh/MocA family oxidoreductase [Chloroflexota bacterium]|nr:Gfo/Idh/MocA family oxidoreductase [Chloroflexota bacterium]